MLLNQRSDYLGGNKCRVSAFVPEKRGDDFMPKVLPLSSIERKKEEFRKWIKGKRNSEDVTQEMFGEKIGISQQAAGRKMLTSRYTYTDLLILFKTVNATDEEILKMMKL